MAGTAIPSEHCWHEQLATSGTEIVLVTCPSHTKSTSLEIMFGLQQPQLLARGTSWKEPPMFL